MEVAIKRYLHSDNYHLRSFYLASKAYHAFLTQRSRQALDWARQALTFRNQAEGEIYSLQCHLILGTVLRELDNYKEAEFHLLQALSKSQTTASSFFEASCYVQLALLSEMTGNNDTMKQCINKALQLASEKSYYNFFMWRDDLLLRFINLAQDTGSYQGYLEELIQHRSLMTSELSGNTGGLEQIWKKKRPESFEFFMLGTAILEINGEVIDLGSRRAVYLLSLLCTREEPISMDKILEEMWPDWDYHTARNNFYFTLHRLRKFLNNKDLIPFKNGQCWIESELFWTDIKQFDLLVEESRRLLNSNQKNRALAMLTHASALYRGELLEGMELGPILALEKETMAKKYCVSLVATGQILLEIGDYHRAVEVLTQASLNAFADEQLYRLLMLAYYASGNRRQALEIYQNFSQFLDEEMGAQPQKATRQLRDLIRSGQDISITEIVGHNCYL